MAVVNTKSTAVTNADATPRVLTSANIAGGRVRQHIGHVAVASGDDDGSVFRMARIRSSDVVTSIQIMNTAMTGSTSWDVGLYQTAANGGLEADKDLWTSALDINAGNAQWAEVMFEALAPEKIEKRVWELLGLSADPHREYDLCLTANTVGSAGGKVLCKVQVVNDQ